MRPLGGGKSETQVKMNSSQPGKQVDIGQTPSQEVSFKRKKGKTHRQEREKGRAKGEQGDAAQRGI